MNTVSVHWVSYDHDAIKLIDMLLNVKKSFVLLNFSFIYLDEKSLKKSKFSLKFKLIQKLFKTNVYQQKKKQQKILKKVQKKVLWIIYEFFCD